MIQTGTSTSELIAAVADRLTPTERLISEAVLGEPTLLAFGTVADLAERVGTSGPSIVRFATKLGFKGYSDLQDYVRHGMSHELAKPSERIRAAGAAPETAALGTALESVFALVDNDYLQKQPNDRIDDFQDVFDFNQAFNDGFAFDAADPES